MLDIETIRLSAEIIGYLAGITSVVFLAIQYQKQRKLDEYKTLLAMEEKYTSLLWRASSNKIINEIWEPLPKERKDLFDSLIKDCSRDSWPIWKEMDNDEHECYRFTRAGFEILEQAYLADKKGWISDKEIQQKWENWTLSWKNKNVYTPYVLAEMESWFTPSFITYFQTLEENNNSNH